MQGHGIQVCSHIKRTVTVQVGCKCVFYSGDSQAIGGRVWNLKNDCGTTFPMFASDVDSAIIAQYLVEVYREDHVAALQIPNIETSLRNVINVAWVLVK